MTRSSDEDTYTTAEAAAVSGFSPRQLDYWDHQAMIRPTSRAASGKGTVRLYSHNDLIRLRFLSRLKKSGWSTQKARTALGILHEVLTDPDPLKNALLVHDRGTLLVISKTEAGERILSNALAADGQLVMAIVLETLSTETLNAVRQQK